MTRYTTPEQASTVAQIAIEQRDSDGTDWPSAFGYTAFQHGRLLHRGSSRVRTRDEVTTGYTGIGYIIDLITGQNFVNEQFVKGISRENDLGDRVIESLRGEDYLNDRVIQTDSERLINQIKGYENISDPFYQNYRFVTLNAAHDAGVRFEYIPSEDNIEAQYQAELALYR